MMQRHCTRITSIIDFAKHINLYGCREAILKGLQRGDLEAVLEKCDDAIFKCVGGSAEALEQRNAENYRRLQELEGMIEQLKEEVES